MVCPIDGNTIYSDGHWDDTTGSAHVNYRYASTLRQGLGQVLISAGAGALLIGLGSFVKHAHRQREPDEGASLL